MSTLSVPLSHFPPYTLLALASLKKAPIQWDDAANELAEPSFRDVKGVEQVRAALEEGLPGKEVSVPLIPAEYELMRKQIPLPPLPTMLESNTAFKEAQGVLDALDDYLAYRWV